MMSEPSRGLARTSEGRGGDWAKMKLNLLSSGVPLERLTATTLIGLRFRDFGERVFEREGKYFSIDMVAIKEGELPEASDLPARLALFVECKYLRPPNLLIFASFPEPKSDRSLRAFSVNAFSAAGSEKMAMVRASTTGEAFESLRNTWIPQSDKTCYKGAVVSDQESKDIFREAQYQLAFPLVEAYLADLKTAARLLQRQTPIPPALDKILSVFGNPPMMSLYVPIVVTNAPLYVLHDDTDLHNIEESKNIVDIADSVPFVNYTATIPAEMGNYLNANKDAKDLIQTAGESAEREYESVVFGAMNLYLIPRRYHFVQLNGLKSFIETLESQFRELCVKTTVEEPAAFDEEHKGSRSGQDSFKPTVDRNAEK